MTTTDYIYRCTIAVPEAHIGDANQLALVLGESAADDKTFTAARWQDAEGNKYAVCSTVAKAVFVDRAGQPLAAPEFAPDADLAAAGRAQALLRINSGPVTPDDIAAISGDRLESAMDHIGALGLTAFEEEGPDQPLRVFAGT